MYIYTRRTSAHHFLNNLVLAEIVVLVVAPAVLVLVLILILPFHLPPHTPGDTYEVTSRGGGLVDELILLLARNLQDLLGEAGVDILVGFRGALLSLRSRYFAEVAGGVFEYFFVEGVVAAVGAGGGGGVFGHCGIYLWIS